MKTVLIFASSTVALASAALILAGTLLLSSPRAEATASDTQRTGKPCGFCHSRPPALNAQGKKYKANGRKL